MPDPTDRDRQEAREIVEKCSTHSFRALGGACEFCIAAALVRREAEKDSEIARLTSAIPQELANDVQRLRRKLLALSDRVWEEIR